ncbi:hypothetical protein K504DRAFT_181238 [Pleomassaria siparia CBS 279.74]|uniref:Zn(2)-C6 fungal-type domain-containing protein n=1 Tax=Pleomassaria siparia CBS 279.74 TaxID=1314801 RepID=A0A6G1JSM1_9PLEO|nr:hypothetical protein K504DRAFT_181238 [Pleomassaria siparia CBS 279.74]
MVTQRRIHSVYHRNIEILNRDQMMNWDLSPWAHAESLTPLRDELWQEIFNTGFEFLADDSMAIPDAESIAPPKALANTNSSEQRKEAPEPPSVDVDLLVESIPACTFCRAQHTRCDRKFPSCGACAKSNRRCLYYDAVLQKEVERSYVYGLYKRLQATTEGFISSNSVLRPPARESLAGRDAMPGVLVVLNTGSTCQDDHMRLNNCYFGSSSMFSRLEDSLLSNAHPAFPSESPNELRVHGPIPSVPQCLVPQLPSITVSVRLFEHFSTSVNVFYPAIKQETLDRLLSDMYISSDETVMDAHDEDLLYLVLAIGSQLSRRSNSGLTHEPHVYFSKATYRPERTRDSWLRMDQLLLLQRNVLICLYLLLNPAAGDIWRNLGFAIRLYFDLSHRPSTNDDIDEELMGMLFRTVYSLECQVSIAFGRPSLLVIGDKIRSEMIAPVSGTVAETISFFSYRISLLKMQIHSCMLSRFRKNVGRQTYHVELETWLADWTDQVKPSNSNDHTDTSLLQQVLDAWAKLNYHHTALLLAQLDGTAVASIPESLTQHSDHIIRSSSFLARHLQKSLQGTPTTSNPQQPILSFPLNWTDSHLIFSVGLILPVADKRRMGVGGADETTRITRRCLILLALLEGDSTMLSTGLSEVLERLIQDDDSI